ncbi:MAG: hypothetical protein GWP91_21720 [Rhodobacterales bacterium]|nr:hypothetical protein [Rhodobacterales bacterium]
MRLLLFTIGLTFPPLCCASGPETFGIGGRFQGAGGGGIALVDDGTSALVNPAGLGQIRRPVAGIGTQTAIPAFQQLPALWWDTNRDGSVDQRDAPLVYPPNDETVSASQIHLGRQIGGKFGIGFTAHVPMANLVRFKTFDPSLPTYIMWENRLQRFTIAAGVGGEVLPGFAIGVGVDILAAAHLDVTLTADVSVSGAQASTATNLDPLVTEVVMDIHEIDMRMVPVPAPTFGFQWDVGTLIKPLNGFILAAAYHGEVGLPITLGMDIQANVNVDELGSLDPYITSLIADAQVQLFDHYVPRKITLGLAYRRADTLTLYADLKWSDWSRMQLNVAQLTDATLTSPLIDLSDVIRDGNPLEVILRPVWSYRMGTELQLPEWEVDSKFQYVRLVVRGGFGVEPSPLISQRADTMLLDSGRSFFTLGAGVETWDPLSLVDGAVHLDLFFQSHILKTAFLDRQTDVPRAGFPVGQAGFPIGGRVFVFGGEWGFEY